jgi:archaellum component FlaC
MKTEEQLKFEADLLRLEQEMDGIQRCLDNVRSEVIEEVAQHIEKLTSFGADTVSGLAIYVREMKK